MTDDPSAHRSPTPDRWCSMTLGRAERFIAKLTRGAEESARKSRERVHDHIRKAKGRKRKPAFDAPRDPGARVTQEFWRWAALEWPALQHIPDFPYGPPGATGLARLPGLRGFAYGYQVPADHDQLLEAFHAIHHEYGELLREHRQCIEQLVKVMRDLEAANSALERRRQNDAARSRKHSEAGKRGKGVPRRRSLEKG